MAKTLTVLGVLVLGVGGGLTGAYAADTALGDAGWLTAQPALAVPGSIAGIGIGGIAGLGVLLGLRALPGLGRTARPGALSVVGKALFATGLGVVAYQLIVAGLVWLTGLALPTGVTMVLAVILSVVGLPFAGPVAYRLLAPKPQGTQIRVPGRITPQDSTENPDPAP
ncbi:MAG: hypothetical protein HOU81_03250 [Hamadaea sp.]|uniref:hypothetical protein n=1 Tax=Hamadaea sp. TaxID=2024425 RepID=UPI00181C7DF9|nr:hypothetical protein [Hamadaea sp.]NUR69812.1 hypothetical protein [Hamadaea sp.]NUT19208.1 hypothetical protein [Hamadaea sp.]